MKHFHFANALLEVREDDSSPFSVIATAAQNLARDYRGGKGTIFTCRHLGIMISIADDSDLELVTRDFIRAFHGYIIPCVSAYPEMRLSAKELARDELIYAANQRLENERSMVLVSHGAWYALCGQALEDSVLAATVSYTVRVARLAQLSVSKGMSAHRVSQRAVVRAFREAGVPTLDNEMGNQIVRGAIDQLHEHWRLGSSLNPFLETWWKTDDLVRRAMIARLQR